MDGVPAGRRPAGRTPRRGSLRAVSGALDLAVGDAARTLAGLDLARWNPEVPALLAGLAKTAPGPALPGDHDPLAVSVLGRAQRLAAVLDLAMADAPGAAVNHAQAARPGRRAAAAGRRGPRGHDRRVQLRPAGPSAHGWHGPRP